MFVWPIADTLVLLLVAGVAAWAIARLWSRTIGFLWASGVDGEHQLAHTIAPVRLLLGIAVVAIALTPLKVGDASGVAELIGVMLLFGLIGASYFRDIIGGIALSIRRPFTVAAQNATEQASGRVVELGLTRVLLRTPSGAMVDLPTREVSAKRVSTAQRCATRSRSP